MVASGICARRTSTGLTCSTEGAREKTTTWLKVKAARDCPVAACGRGHQETGPTSQEPKACWEAKLFQENKQRVRRSEDGSGQRAQDQRVT